MSSPRPETIGEPLSLATTYDPSALTGVLFCAATGPMNAETASTAAPIRANERVMPSLLGGAQPKAVLHRGGIARGGQLIAQHSCFARRRATSGASAQVPCQRGALLLERPGNWRRFEGLWPI